MATKSAKKNKPGKGAAAPKKTQPKPKPALSPVELVRDIPVATRCMLWGIAGGRCEFRGHNKYLLEHEVTSMTVNLADVAHVVAFKKQGPRGKKKRPKEIHDLENLMLLCKDCHKQIDDDPDQFPRELLVEHKREHERRIRQVTGLSPNMRTTVVQLKALVADKPADIPVAHVYDAVSPRWPTSQEGYVINLNGVPVESPSGAQAAAARIDAEVRNLYAEGMDAQKTRHISLFALAPIPVLMHLGARLSDKIPLDLYQRHRGQESPWVWPEDASPVEYAVSRVQQGSQRDRVALVLSLSGRVERSSLPAEIDETFTVYEITLKDITPNPDFLRRRDDLERFRHAYRLLLSELTRDHGPLKEIAVFPAVPAPIGVALGHDVMPKAQPDLVAYDFDKKQNGFTLTLRITR